MLEEGLLEQHLARLRDPDWRIRMRAARDVGELRDVGAFDALVQALADPRIDVRLAATASLARADAARALDHLIDQLERHDNYAAASALGCLGDRRATGALVRKLSQVLSRGRLRTPEDDAMCVRAAEALGQLKDPIAVEILVALGRDHNWGLRQAAARALGEIGNPRGMEVLLELLADAHVPVRSAAVRSLGKLGQPQAVEPLIRVLRAEGGDMACAAAEALGNLGDARALDVLVNHLQSTATTSRCFAAVALGKLRDPRGLEPLLRALRDSAAEVRCGAAEGLGYLGDPQALAELERSARHDDGEWELGSVRDFAREAVGRIKRAKSP